MTIEKKLQEIIRAAKSGMPLSQIDVKGHGGSARRILQGSKVGTQKIEEMYANLVAFHELRTQKKAQAPGNIFPALSATREQKIKLIVESVKKGIPKVHLDPKGHGKGIERLQQGGKVSDNKLDEMYRNLLVVNDQRAEKHSATSDAWDYLVKKVKSQEILVASLFDRIASLEAGMEKLQKDFEQKKESDKRPPKILGVSLLRKTDVVHGQKYSRWYGLYNLNGKRCFIYIGKDVSKAKAKIESWLNSHVAGGSR